MNVLLVYPLFPKTYWGMEYTRRLTGRRALLPPLGLLTVAALLPPGWRPRLVDLNVEPLQAEALRWADVVFVSAMQVQHVSYHEVIRRAHAAGKTVVVGGPYATTDPEASRDADCIVLGECEDLLAELCADLSRASLAPRYQAAERPGIARAPVPRFDLLRPQAYHSLGLQFSRGCPFTCEFCDIIEIFGRVPRTKPPEQLLAELEAVYATGFRGSLFLVDDNFIGNKAAARKLLAPLTEWMRRHEYPFDLYTEASVDLAAHDELIESMVEAGFSAVFLGIETPSREALAETHKRQNLHLDLRQAVEKLTRAGLEVMAGFIVGFDADDGRVFERQRAFIQGSPIALAMVGLLTALPGTQLWRRLEGEGRLRAASQGDPFGRTNFVTRLPEEDLLEGYTKLLSDLYDPDAYFARCLRLLELLPARREGGPGYGLAFGLRTLWKSVVFQGLVGPYRAAYWRFLRAVIRRTPQHFARAVALAVTAEHLIRYTRTDVVPALRGPRDPARMRAAPAGLPPTAALSPDLVRLPSARGAAG
jgi:radical SAM superfamily enzyme YgiQ (UPF0313 family)